MAWCRTYLSAKYLAWPQFTSTILGILVFFSCGKSTSHVCKWMHIYAHSHCILCEYMYKWSFWGRVVSACQELKEFNWYCTNGLVPKDARACICTFLEHHFIADDPFQHVQQWFSWNYISKYSYFFYELLCSETLFLSCWRHGKTFFMNSLFFHLLLQLVSCPVFLN